MWTIPALSCAWMGEIAQLRIDPEVRRDRDLSAVDEHRQERMDVIGGIALGEQR
jgi:hypothetical protein